MPLKVSARDLVARAEQRVAGLAPEQVVELRDQPDVLLVDIRDVRERARDGYIPGALHAPRGMLEFWVDPDSPYHKPAFAEADRIVLHCNKGWRSALAAAALMDMGVENVAHMDGGFDRWSREVGIVETKDAPG